MKVLICAMAYPPDTLGGGEISTRLLAEALSQQNVDVSVLTMTDGQPGLQMQNGIAVNRIACPNVYWAMRSREQSPLKKIRWHLSQSFGSVIAAEIQSAVLDRNPDLVHTSTIEDFGAKFWSWAKQKRFKTVHTLRSQCLLHRSANMYDAKRDRDRKPDWLSSPKRRHSANVDGVVGISQDILDRHLKHRFFPAAKSTVIGNPFEGVAGDARIRSEGPIRLGILGRIEPDKGIGPLLDTLRHVKTDPPWRLQIAGTGEDDFVDHLRRKSEGLPVEFLGWSDSREFLVNLDLLIIPSRCVEAFGRGVVEAFSVGVPVLCLRRGGLPELINHGTTGWVLDQWSDTEVTRCIEDCRKLASEAMIEKAKRFSTKEIASQYRVFYQQIMKLN
ncbi:D-inositol 3-phosphate glycosyltransferase [Rubripirellula obstinata]|uniref:D-inositol 3-phosphate glycosyltransferase n=1 Tax=Rubripirellula obstinata TaxID=406547 RepID=A0A5B1CCD7_9BACT|nr:glycosyltransferase [Rubripirellula obstinata]KAA1258797.1 D-inositol 3-phosphate glycosyltransferase [Rubripirellula obstinata]